MSVEHVRTSVVRDPETDRAGRRLLTTTGTQPSRAAAPESGSVCFVVNELTDGDGAALVRTLRRRGSTRAVLLTRTAGRRELLSLLGGGVRGAVASDSPGALRIAARQVVGPAPAPRTGPELTAREIGVLRLVADGRSNRQIGEHLDLSALTVKSHLARISRKVGTGDRAEMVAFAIRHDLLA
ncbi:response regulator transcription factor [Actinotalea sp. K2]|uniref:helix-turn-helix transcriptional regulator n=1 Tax=Actinotalea sp. K2 TaxID=2939438 RepID=UPI002017A7B5|nr:response regulator transcription factor [Actinotalea sp. K2]MCL3862223.1 response regulator transcription factor [Actinotalea sp. K2]